MQLPLRKCHHTPADLNFAIGIYAKIQMIGAVNRFGLSDVP